MAEAGEGISHGGAFLAGNKDALGGEVVAGDPWHAEGGDPQHGVVAAGVLATGATSVWGLANATAIRFGPFTNDSDTDTEAGEVFFAVTLNSFASFSFNLVAISANLLLAPRRSST